MEHYSPKAHSNDDPRFNGEDYRDGNGRRNQQDAGTPLDLTAK